MSVEGSSRVALISALLLGLILAVPAHAGLGLGEARVQSYLGQTLDVRIALLQPSESALQSLTVEVASVEDHVRLGVPVEALALGLSAELDQSVDPPVIRLRSSRAGTDPFVQVLINARWASGRMLREYTLFLDPPAVPLAPPIRRRDDSPTRAQTVPVPEAETAPEPVEPPAPPPVQREPELQTAAESSQPVEADRQAIGPVPAGQTLWSIASSWRPDDTLSMNQIMLAILERNPDAFIGNNVNRLRRGARLTMPDLSEVEAISPAQANRRIREQTEAWEALRTGQPAVPAVAELQETPSVPDPEAVVAPDIERAMVDEQAAQAETEPGADERPEAEPVQPLPRLELTPPTEDIVADIQILAAERERLEGRLGILEEEILAERFGSEELAANVEQIRQAIDSADSGGLMVAREDLALLEQQLRAARQEREQRAAAQLAEAEPAAPGEVMEPVSTPPTAATGSPAWLWPAVAAVVALGLLVLVLQAVMRRRRHSADDLVEKPAVTEPLEPVEPPAATVAAVGLDAKLSELYDLAEQDEREAFASAFERFEAEVSDPLDPRWVEANDLARQVIPGHPLVLHRRSGEADSAAGDRDEDAEALFGILDGDESSTPDKTVSGPDFGYEPPPDRNESPSESEEHPDLAKLSNRLDTDERDPSAGDRVRLEEDEEAELFAEPDKAILQGEDEDAEEPLSLDFEFSAREDEGDEAAAELDVEEDPDPSDPKTASDAAQAADETPAPRNEVFDVPADELDDEFRPIEPEIGSDPDGEVDEDDDWFTVGEPDLAPEDLQGDAEDRTGAALSDDDAEVKMDLARAYLSMDDVDSARALLDEIMADGSETHRELARRLLDELK